MKKIIKDIAFDFFVYFFLIGGLYFLYWSNEKQIGHTSSKAGSKAKTPFVYQQF
jgi:hypothetical protein